MATVEQFATLTPSHRTVIAVEVPLPNAVHWRAPFANAFVDEVLRSLAPLATNIAAHWSSCEVGLMFDEHTGIKPAELALRLERAVAAVADDWRGMGIPL